MNALTHTYTPKGLKEWRERRFPAPSAKASRQRAAEWYGVSRRAWEHYEYGERPIPRTLMARIREYESFAAPAKVGRRAGLVPGA